jgi:predicted ester cyclase
MQRYCFAYTATHDFSVADAIMADDYTFYMGEHVFTGREEAYKPAAQRQFKVYPGLGFTVHDFFSNGDRCAMYFSEHGFSAQENALTAWHGVSLYRWNGERLTECRIEQDYYGRRRQLKTLVPDPIDPPAFAPWSAPVRPADPTVDQFVTEWLERGGLLKSRIGSLDDERVAPSIDRVLFTDERVEVLDIMSAGPRAAFQARISGVYVGGLQGLSQYEGAQASLHATGIVDTHDGQIGGVRAVTDRYTMERRLRAA